MRPLPRTFGEDDMTFSRIACCAALIVGLAQTISPAGACDGPDCRAATKSKPQAKPLQLGKFMRHSSAKNAAHASKRGDGHRQVTLARQRKHTSPPAAAAPEAIPVEAAAAFASQPSAQVRVVASDELNEIDRAAGPVPIETTGAGWPAEQAVQFADAADYNDIDRKSDDLRLASLASVPSNGDVPMRGDQASRSWIERLWARLQNAFIAVAAAVRYLFS